MNVAVGRLQMTVRWMASRERRGLVTEMPANPNAVERAYRRARLARQIEAERAHWESQSRSNLRP